jgi:hypothetical protein
MVADLASSLVKVEKERAYAAHSFEMTGHHGKESAHTGRGTACEVEVATSAECVVKTNEHHSHARAAIQPVR